MEQLLNGIYYMIYGYIDEAQSRYDYLESLIRDAIRGNYEKDALMAYQEEHERLGKEIQKLSALAEEVNHMH